MNKRKEKISAFLDNDMHRDELMSFSLSAEADDAKIAQRYQIIGETLRGELSDSSFVDVSQAVRQALADENITEQMNTEIGITGTQPSSKSKHGLFDLSAWLRPAAGMAIAVMAAVILVVTLSEQKSSNFAPITANNVINGQGQPAEVQKTANVETDKKATDMDPRLNQHLVNQHLEYATQDALQGRLPYVRAVSYEAEK